MQPKRKRKQWKVTVASPRLMDKLLSELIGWQVNPAKYQMLNTESFLTRDKNALDVVTETFMKMPQVYTIVEMTNAPSNK